MRFPIILAMQLPSQFIEQLFSEWFTTCVLRNGIFLSKKQIIPLEKLITSAISLKVAVRNVKCIFNIDILVNQNQSNICAVGEIFWRIMVQFRKADIWRCSGKKFLKFSPATLLKKTAAQMFSCEFCEILKSTFFQKSANGYY